MDNENQIGTLLKSLRNRSGMPVRNALELLNAMGYNITKATFYNYESGFTMPNADIFLALCRIYNCRNPLDYLSKGVLIETEENKLTERYKQTRRIMKFFEMLDDSAQKRVSRMIEGEIADMKERKDGDN